MTLESRSVPLRLRAKAAGVALLAATILAIFWLAPAVSKEEAVVIPPPSQDEDAGGGMETAVFAGGCFWGVEGVFEHVKGVANAVSGYSGGSKETAQYRTIGSGRTGHAEAVEVTYDPGQVTYGQLLQIYFSVAHDPTQLDRQGPDVGTQYRSAIFTRGDEQMSIADAYIAQLDEAGVYGSPIVTTTEVLKAFYPAEDYHQDFMSKNPNHGYIVINDRPKVENLKRLFPNMYRETPVFSGAAKS